MVAISRKMGLKSLASLKRAIGVGTVIYVEKHWQPQLTDTTRVVEQVQGNGYYFQGRNSKDEICRMWAPYPKASQLRFNDDGSVVFYPDEQRSWTIAVSV